MLITTEWVNICFTKVSGLSKNRNVPYILFLNYYYLPTQNFIESEFFSYNNKRIIFNKNSPAELQFSAGEFLYN